MNDDPVRLAAFEGYGIELEYMIVHRDTLDVSPIADAILRQPDGQFVDDVERGALAWSNELVSHVIELKTNGPAGALEPLGHEFHKGVRDVNALLAPFDGRLMPTAMHPWMHPDREMQLWPHGYNAVYKAFDRIFNCRGHGWSNLQSMHINLPFADDSEFARLHAAIRVVLPLLPALAASSPLREGALTGLLDTRLDVYRGNCARIPSITGRVVPESVTSRSDYEHHILQPMYRDIAPYDPDGLLQSEWLNARGAIARFDRSAIEIRVLDIQECPSADIAIAALIVEVIKALFEERWCKLSAQQLMQIQDLEQLLLANIRDGELAIIDDRQFLDLFAISEQRCESRELWQCLLERVSLSESCRLPVENVINQGPLARRILRSVGSSPSRSRLTDVYRQLCDCLADDRQYLQAG